MYQITVSDITVDVVRKDIKNMHLAVYPPMGRVRLAAPLEVNEDAIRLFAISKIGWIRRHQRKFENQERETPREYKERESHYFQGRRYLMRIKETTEPGYVVLRGKTYIDLYVKEGMSVEYKRNVMNEWYRAELRRVIPEIIERWEKKMDVRVNHWEVRQMKTKWGSCNIEKGIVRVNLELAKKPIHCLEYIVVHEMVHLLERLHNDRFIFLMDHYLPNWRQMRSELNRIEVGFAQWREGV